MLRRRSIAAGGRHDAPRPRSTGAGLAGFAGLAASVFLLSSPSIAPTHAQGADLTLASCAQYTALPQREREQMGLWLHGYFTGASQRPVLDMAQLEQAIVALVAYCAAVPDRPLLGAETGAFMRSPAPQAAASAFMPAAAPVQAEGSSRSGPASPGQAGGQPQRPRPAN